MKVVILAGGFGTRISEESHLKPKPMIEIGDMPILWHIMKIYSHYGFNEFIICAGYKQRQIKEWFADYFMNTSDVTFDYTSENGSITYHDKSVEPWKVTVVNTGLNTQTGGRIKRVQKYIGQEPFMLSYGDGVADINIPELIKFHRLHHSICTLSMYNYGQHKGVVEVSGDGMIEAFREKSDDDSELINIGFMILEPEIFNYIKDDDTAFEKEPMEALVEEKKLAGYVHTGYWQCMDTLREKNQIEQLWNDGNAPWKIWED
ncbi:glucose-1-phosphate cytidylyltransferase [Butyrivibrio fibrisolvens DSM 3071]|uniref:Glucose-1-phosphate cytidylyltransferase n=1 Tax=Butyrivibrio fibrisolvens DSM 3071 TaxID=1121131 RepID=A0A1M5YZ16_BUTFI|nr:glucose-1-phosphate cytidylyltransferase [Butyrivibrio fibrisolvens]SHI17195.1 glucose-1-phosphate cytidylyltransferase [Butyrivibrio fibrisolvens DSM 3071]